MTSTSSTQIIKILYLIWKWQAKYKVLRNFYEFPLIKCGFLNHSFVLSSILCFLVRCAADYIDGLSGLGFWHFPNLFFDFFIVIPTPRGNVERLYVVGIIALFLHLQQTVAIFYCRLTKGIYRFCIEDCCLCCFYLSWNLLATSLVLECIFW